MQLIKDWAPRIHFVHLRNTKRIEPSFENYYSLYEAAHLEGDTDIVAVIENLLLEEKTERKVADGSCCPAVG